MTYPTLANLRTWVNVATGDDSPLQWAVDAAIAYVEKSTGRLFVAATETRSYVPGKNFVSHDHFTLHLMNDLVSVTTLTNGDGVEISSSDYTLYSNSGSAPYHQIVLHPWSSVRFGFVSQNITVAGDWGYSADCPDDVFEAILVLAQHDYLARQTGQGGPVAVGARRSGLVIPADKIPALVETVIARYTR